MTTEDQASRRALSAFSVRGNSPLSGYLKLGTNEFFAAYISLKVHNSYTTRRSCHHLKGRSWLCPLGHGGKKGPLSPQQFILYFIAVSEAADRSVVQSGSPSIGQLISEVINQSISRSASQSIVVSISLSVNQRVYESLGQSVSQ
jgi:hypothetical protein